MIDETMRALLAVHRDEINDRDQQIENLTYQANEADHLRREIKRRDEKIANLTKAANEAKAEARAAGEDKAKITKLEGVIATLKIELADAREAATTARDAAES